VSDRAEERNDGIEPQNNTHRRVRADARRNVDALLQATKAVFASSGVDAPVREIAEKAGVGIGTVYRHFPERSDFVAAVSRREIDACADAAQTLAVEHEPFEALAKWDAAIRSFHRNEARACEGAALGRSSLRHLAGLLRPTPASGTSDAAPGRCRGRPGTR